MNEIHLTTHKITIVEMLIFGDNEGHSYDYLQALCSALSRHTLEITTPYSKTKRRQSDSSRMQKIRRLHRYFVTYRTLIRRRGIDLIILPTPLFMDSIAYFFASLCLMKSGRPLGLFVLRREAESISQSSAFKAWLMKKSLQYLCRRKHIYPISDSESALENWKAVLGVKGSLVQIPVRPIIERRNRNPRDGVNTVGLLGAARLEKGLLHYDKVISSVLRAGPTAAVNVQLPEKPRAEDAGPIQEVRDRWQGDDRVQILPGYLSSEEYVDAFSGTNIVVLPYEVDAYGTGTSGILHEALTGGIVAISTRFVWATETYGEHPLVVWLDDLSETSIIKALAAANRILEAPPDNPASEENSDNFSASWQQAICDAIRWRTD